MLKNEIEMLKNEDFVERIKNYDHDDIIELITNAWIDTNNTTLNEDEEYTDDFVTICENINKGE